MTDEIRKQIDGLQFRTFGERFPSSGINRITDDYIKKSDVIELVEKLYTFRKEEAPSEELVEQIGTILKKSAIELYAECDGESSLSFEPDYVLPESRFGIVSFEIAKLLTTDLLSSQMYQAGIIEGKRQAEETIADLRSALGDIQGEMTEKAFAFAEWIAVMRCTCSMATLKWTIPHIIEDCTTAELYEQFQNAEPK